MADVALQAHVGTGAVAVRPRLDRGFQPRTIIMFLLLLAAGLFELGHPSPDMTPTMSRLGRHLQAYRQAPPDPAA